MGGSNSARSLASSDSALRLFPFSESPSEIHFVFRCPPAFLYDEYNTEANQLIIVARGVGGTGDVKLTKEKCYLTNLSISVEIDTSIALPEYLYYYFSIRNLRYLDSGSAQSQITISDLARVEIPLPNIEIQKKIVHCLGVLDRKISANEAINDNLEQQAQALYQELFITNTDPSWETGTISNLGTVIGGSTPSKARPEYYTNIRYVIAVRVFHKNKAPFEAGFGPANDDYESSAITT